MTSRKKAVIFFFPLIFKFKKVSFQKIVQPHKQTSKSGNERQRRKYFAEVNARENDFKYILNQIL